MDCTKSWFFDDLGPLDLHLHPSLLAILNELEPQTQAQIFTHSSFDQDFNYEHLEYLGDSILQVAATLFLEEKYRNLSRGENNAIRLRLIGKIALSQFSLALGLQTRIRTGPKIHRPGQAILEDVFEAMLGGIYRDLTLERAIHWCRKMFEAVWETSESYFVEDEAVRRRYGIPSPKPPHKSQDSPLSPRSPPSPSPLLSSSSVLPSVQMPSTRTAKKIDHSKSELIRVCHALQLGITYKSISSAKSSDGGVIWVERVEVGDGRYTAEGTAWSMKGAQSAAAAKVLEERELQGVPKKEKRARLR